MKERVIYNGPKRPLIHVPNFPDIYMEDGDIFSIDGKRVWKSNLFDYTKTHGYHRHFAVLSNLLSYNKYGILNNEQAINEFKRILSGEEKSVLEEQFEKQNKLKHLLPKKDFIAACFQFSNEIRPTIKFEYKGDKYISSSEFTPPQLARYLHSNLFVILPDGIEHCDAETFEIYYEKQTKLIL
jgi:hypothetical protein